MRELHPCVDSNHVDTEDCPQLDQFRTCQKTCHPIFLINCARQFELLHTGWLIVKCCPGSQIFAKSLRWMRCNRAIWTHNHWSMKVRNAIAIVSSIGFRNGDWQSSSVDRTAKVRVQVVYLIHRGVKTIPILRCTGRQLRAEIAGWYAWLEIEQLKRERRNFTCDKISTNKQTSQNWYRGSQQTSEKIVSENDQRFPKDRWIVWTLFGLAS